MDEKKVEKSYFDGGTWGLFWRNLLAFLATVITLGIAYPWIICWLLRWKKSHTVINGKRQYFDGKGIQLFGKYILWWFLSIITLGIFTLWLSVKMMQWTAKHTHFQGEEDNNSFFDGGVLGNFGIHILGGLITAATFGIAKSFADVLILRWERIHTVCDSRRLVFNGKGSNLWVKYFVWGFLSIITLGIYQIFVPVKYMKWETENTVDDEHTIEATVARSEYNSKIAMAAVSVTDLEELHTRMLSAADEAQSAEKENAFELLNDAKRLFDIYTTKGGVLTEEESKSYRAMEVAIRKIKSTPQKKNKALQVVGIILVVILLLAVIGLAIGLLTNTSPLFKGKYGFDLSLGLAKEEDPHDVAINSTANIPSQNIPSQDLSAYSDLFGKWVAVMEDGNSAAWERITFNSDGTFEKDDNVGIKVDNQTDNYFNGNYYMETENRDRYKGTYNVIDSNEGFITVACYYDEFDSVWGYSVPSGSFNVEISFIEHGRISINSDMFQMQDFYRE